MDWDKLRTFYAVVEAGNFTRAGEHLHLSQSAVSRQIRQLEHSVGAFLFFRHSRGLILTEQGDILYRAAQEASAKLSTAQALINEDRERPSGPLRLTSTVALGSTWLAAQIGGFMQRYPEISLSLLLRDQEIDLSVGEADVALRLTPPKQPNLVQRRLLKSRFQLFASSQYLEHNSMPRSIEALKAHRILIYGSTADLPFPQANWLRDLADGEAGRDDPCLTIEIDNYLGIFHAVQGGAGIAALPNYLARRGDDLVRVLPDLEGPEISVYFIYPEEMRHSKKIIAMRDYLVEKVAQRLGPG